MLTKKVGDVLVFQHGPDYDDLAFSTLERLECFLHPGTDARIEHLFKNALIGASLDVELVKFLNPMFTVTASRPSNEFIHQARRAQKCWIAEFKKFLGRDLNGFICELSPLIRQLVFSGVLILGGKHYRPDQWPQQIRAPPKQYDLQGKVFGRLTVVERLPQGKWKCRCECGNEHIVRTKHLLHNKIKSCGCLKAELDQRKQNRRHSRAWVKS